MKSFCCPLGSSRPSLRSFFCAVEFEMVGAAFGDEAASTSSIRSFRLHAQRQENRNSPSTSPQSAHRSGQGRKSDRENQSAHHLCTRPVMRCTWVILYGKTRRQVFASVISLSAGGRPSVLSIAVCFSKITFAVFSDSSSPFLRDRYTKFAEYASFLHTESHPLSRILKGLLVVIDIPSPLVPSDKEVRLRRTILPPPLVPSLRDDCSLFHQFAGDLLDLLLLLLVEEEILHASCAALKSFQQLDLRLIGSDMNIEFCEPFKMKIPVVANKRERGARLFAVWINAVKEEIEVLLLDRGREYSTKRSGVASRNISDCVQRVLISPFAPLRKYPPSSMEASKKANVTPVCRALRDSRPIPTAARLSFTFSACGDNHFNADYLPKHSPLPFLGKVSVDQPAIAFDRFIGTEPVPV